MMSDRSADASTQLFTTKHTRQILKSIAVPAALAVLFWFFPLFHVVSLEDIIAKRKAATFNASEYAEQFWHQQLAPAFESATPAAKLLSAIRESPATAREQFGKSPGLGRNYYFFLRGEGTIVSIEKNCIRVSLTSTGEDSDLLLHSGLLFGNAARDATGLVDVNEFVDSQHFNEVSRALNRIIEETVIPKLKNEAQVGSHIEFTGAVEIRSDRDLSELLVVPLSIKCK